MDEFKVKENYTLEDVPKLMRLLRDPEKGCPWDIKQTHESIRQNFLEEVYEAVDAIDKGDAAGLREELGDVLLQVTFHAEIEREKGTFDLDAAADELCKKLVLRHPHIFGDVAADTSEKVLTNWEVIKREEKSQRSGSDAIDAVPSALPALMKSQKVQKRAAYTGFDYPTREMAFDDLRSEVEELSRALSGDGDVEEELGDLIFAAVNVARFSKLDAELALEKACAKFTARFKETERLAGKKGIKMSDVGIDTLNELWYNAKDVIADKLQK